MLPKKVLTIDFGTETIKTALLVEKGEDKKFLLETVPSRGIKRGNISNPTSVKESLQLAINRLKIHYSLPQKAWVIVPGSFIVSYQVESKIEFPGITTISHNDVNEVKNKAKKELLRGNLHLKNYYEIIHVIPQEFIVDGIDGIQNPIGRSGQKLIMKSLIILAAKSHLSTVKKIINSLGLSVEKYIAQSIAAFYGIKDENTYYNNNIVIYLGAGNTEYLYLKDDKPIFVKHIPKGGQDIIDLFIKKLKVSRKEAERLFKTYGSAYALKFSKEEVIEINYANRTAKIPKIIIPGFIHLKLKEILKEIRKEIELRNPEYLKNLNRVFITGGLSKLRDINILAEKIFKAPSVLVQPSTDTVNDPSLCPIVGVNNYANSLNISKKLTDINDDITEGCAKRNWLSVFLKFLLDII